MKNKSLSRFEIEYIIVKILFHLKDNGYLNKKSDSITSSYTYDLSLLLKKELQRELK